MKNKGNPNIAEYGRETQFRTGCEQVEIAREGGIASGEARREKKSRRELSHMIGSLPASTLKNRKKAAEAVEIITNSGIAPEDQTWDAVEVMQQHLKAIDGDQQSFRTLGDLDGDFKQNLDVGLQVSTPEDEEKTLANIFGKCQTKK